MTPRQNLLSLYRRHGLETAPVCFNLCPRLERQQDTHEVSAAEGVCKPLI